MFPDMARAMIFHKTRAVFNDVYRDDDEVYVTIITSRDSVSYTRMEEVEFGGTSSPTHELMTSNSSIEVKTSDL